MWNVSIEGSSEVYVMNGTDFVARFKYANPKSSARHFVKFLVKNFTPQEYAAELATGKAPLTILQTKGFVSYNAIKARKALATA
jgi:hypothetical protein